MRPAWTWTTRNFWLKDPGNQWLRGSTTATTAAPVMAKVRHSRTATASHVPITASSLCNRDRDGGPPEHCPRARTTGYRCEGLTMLEDECGVVAPGVMRRCLGFSADTRQREATASRHRGIWSLSRTRNDAPRRDFGSRPPAEAGSGPITDQWRTGTPPEGSPVVDRRSQSPASVSFPALALAGKSPGLPTTYGSNQERTGRRGYRRRRRFV